MTTTERLHTILQTNAHNIEKLKQIIEASTDQEKAAVNQLIALQREKASFGEQMADKIAAFGGSWKFILIFVLIFVLWITLNTIILQKNAFDPFPFIFLNLGLSTLAAVQAPIILMSQNRRESKDRRREEDEYIINLKSEIEIANLHKKVDLLMLEQMEKLFEVQRVQIEMLQELQRQQEKS